MTNKTTNTQVKFKRSLLASSVVSLLAVSGYATGEQVSEEQTEIIEVKGLRANLISAQALKRDADTFMDGITASDIGSLPDRSVLEAMQRIPGVSIERFAGPDDPDHFSVEGSGAIIRGMSATRSEFNGRDSFTANSGRGLNFQDVSPELMGGVDIYKNQTADMIEGGIGGTVSLRTRKPFDSKGQVVALSGDISYGDVAEKSSPTASALYSNRWQTDAGEFGVLVNFAYSKLYGESHGIQSDAYQMYNAADLPGAENFVGDGSGQVWMPNASNLLMKEDDRTRKGFALATQWKPNDSMLASFQYLRSDAQLAWTENALKYQGGYQDKTTRPMPGTEFEFDDQGLFAAGTLTDSGGWRTGDKNIDHVPRGWGDNAVSHFGQKYQTETRYKETDTLVEDFAFNFDWQVNDNLKANYDLQYVKAETADNDVVVMLGTYALQQYDVTGNPPLLNLSEPWNGLRDQARANNDAAFETHPDSAAFPDGYPGFSDDQLGDQNYFSDANSYWLRSAMDHYERSEGDSIATRLDFTYTPDSEGIFHTIKTGVRFAKRNQVVRTTEWNWGALGPEWSGEKALWLPDIPQHANDYQVIDWADFHNGEAASIPGNQLIHPTQDFVKSLIGVGEPNVARNVSGTWTPYPGRANVDAEYGIFEPGEIYDTTETNKSAYIRLDFDTEAAGKRISGNLGLRYVNLEREALGFVKYPDYLGDIPVPADSGFSAPLQINDVVEFVQVRVTDAMAQDPSLSQSDAIANVLIANPWATEAANYLSADERAFGNDIDVANTAVADYSAVLPSVNVKVELNDDLIMRAAVAKAIAYPDMELVRNRIALGGDIQAQYEEPLAGEPVDPDKPRVLKGVAIEKEGGDGGNPFLKPMESIQYDLSLEWYFDDAGSLTTTLFYKDLENFFIHGAYPRTFVNPETGVSRSFDVTATRNGGKGEMKGVEFAYQQFFTDLPAPFDGLGVQANYTHIKASGVPNNEVPLDDADFVGGDTDTGARVTLDSVPLQGQSEHTVNLVAMYEKYDWSARIAYNWRSKYLLTTRDVISKFPLWYDDVGFMDASVFYNFENVTVGIQGTNLLGTQSETLMQLDDSGIEAGRSWFVQDRRIALVLRATFN
ncbi:TonB-dependent receptor [Catenovulum sp. SX2]|uniref:TonB-dependent receptor n=1 Tax=Catenovulum sp. SX2 TaxID=3398614 RepID=UPI003F868F9E